MCAGFGYVSQRGYCRSCAGIGHLYRTETRAESLMSPYRTKARLTVLPGVALLKLEPPKLDGQWLDHEVEGNPGDWGVLGESGGFVGVTSKDNVLHPFTMTYEEAMDWERKGIGDVCLIPDYIPEAQRLRKRSE